MANGSDRESLIGEIETLRKRVVELEARAKREEDSARPRWDRLFDVAPDPVCVTDQEGTILWANKALAAMMGMPPRSVLGLRCANHPDLSRMWNACRPGQSHTPADAEEQLFGQWFLIKRCQLPVGEDEAQFLFLGRNVSRRKRIERTDALALAKYRSFFDNALDGAFQMTARGRVFSANPALARLLGYESPMQLILLVSEVGRQHFLEPGQFQILTEIIEAQGEANGFELLLKRRDGETVWASASCRRVQDPTGTSYYIEGFLRDESRLKQALAELDRCRRAS